MKWKFNILFVALVCGASFALAEDEPATVAMNTRLTQHPGGTITVEQIAEWQYQFTATANPGYRFLRWSDGVTTPTRSHTHSAVAAVKRYHAVFVREDDETREKGTMTVAVTDGVKPTFTLTAVPDGAKNAQFVTWNNGGEQLTIPYAESEGRRYAYFLSPDKEDFLRLTQHPGGTVTAVKNGGSYNMTATAANGYTFLRWADSGANYDQATRTVSYSQADPKQAYHAVFTRNADITQENGSVSVAIANAAAPSFALTANPNSGAEFVVWNNASEQASALPYSETEGRRVPYFIIPTTHLHILYTQHPGGEVSVEEGSGTYTINADCNPGYSFLRWADSGTDYDKASRTINYSGPERAQYHAVFTRNDDVRDIPKGNVSVTINNEQATSFTLQADGMTGSCFSELAFWNNGSENNPVQYTESEGRRYPFFKYDNDLKYTVDTVVMGTVQVTPLKCGFTLTAQPAAGYAFEKWTDDNSTNPIRDVDFLAESYTAKFCNAMYKVDDQYFVNFADALAAGDNIELLADVSEDVVVPDGRSITFTANNHQINDLTIENGGKMDVVNSMKINNLYLNTTTGSSAQLIHPENISQYAQAFADVTLEAGQSAASLDKWFMFAVPFDVDATTGIAPAGKAGTWVINKDYILWRYDGAKRASSGGGWVKMTTGDLVDGQCYMIGVEDPTNTWRFTKKSSAALAETTSVPLTAYPSTIADAHKNWNALSNTRFQYANLSTDKQVSHVVQAYVNGANPARYDALDFSEATFVMASPFFIQTADNETMLNLSAVSTPNTLYAPQRTASQETKRYKVEIGTNQNNVWKKLDNIFLSVSDDATNTYELGKDVLKMFGGVGNTYLYTEAYGYKLCAQDAAAEDDVVYYTMSIDAPATADYVLKANQGNDQMLLLQDGIVVNSFMDGTCELQLPKGKHTYILQIGIERKIPTSLDAIRASSAVQKIIYNGNLYIINEGAVYNAQGNMVK